MGISDAPYVRPVAETHVQRGLVGGVGVAAGDGEIPAAHQLACEVLVLGANAAVEDSYDHRAFLPGGDVPGFRETDGAHVPLQQLVVAVVRDCRRVDDTVRGCPVHPGHCFQPGDGVLG
jgi:hypothetical protein